MPIQENASLTKVEREVQDGWRPEEDGDGSVLWEGEARCYFQEKALRRVGGGAQSTLVERRVYVDLDSPPVDWEVGLTLTIVPDGMPARSMTVEDSATNRLAVAGPAQGTRLIMEAE